MPTRRKRREQGAGRLRQLPSGRGQARYQTEDGELRSAPLTFDTTLDAAAWLDARAWEDDASAAHRRPDYRLQAYAERWLTARDLKPRTRAGYRQLLDALILPMLGHITLAKLSPARVRLWHDSLDPGTPTRRKHAYLLLHAIMATAVADDLIDANPCRTTALLFPARGGGHMAPSPLYKVWYPAREAAGRPDLRFHDLRHTGATLAAATGATLGDLMARLGHSTPAAALIYQHAASDRDQAIAQALSGSPKRTRCSCVRQGEPISVCGRRRKLVRATAVHSFVGDRVTGTHRHPSRQGPRRFSRRAALDADRERDGIPRSASSSISCA